MPGCATSRRRFTRQPNSTIELLGPGFSYYRADLEPVTISVLMLGTIYTVKVFDLVWIITGGGPGNGTICCRPTPTKLDFLYSISAKLPLSER